MSIAAAAISELPIAAEDRALAEPEVPAKRKIIAKPDTVMPPQAG